MTGLHQVTLSSVKIQAYRDVGNGNENSTAVCSGFLWRHAGQVNLITNWHNVTGQNPDSGQLLGTFAPTHFKCEYKASRIDSQFGTNGTCELSLFDENNTPLWLEHPSGKNVDVVAIPFQEQLPETHEYVVLNEQDFEKEWSPRIGDDGFIVGYPEGFAGEHTTAIWKRGSLASEPYLDHDGKPMLLLDTLGNAGLSGSPVIGRGHGVLHKGENGGGLTSASIFGTWENFLGVYSGRMSSNGIGSQIGRVWKAQVVGEIFEQNKS